MGKTNIKQNLNSNKNNSVTISLVVLFVLIAAVWFLFGRNKPVTDTTPAINVSNFEECKQAGYPIMESYPPQCKIPGGTTFTQDIGNELEKIESIKMMSPRPGETITSPVKITGEARGIWFFEANFPIKIVDENGNEIGRKYAMAQGEWMTEEFVPFTAEINFTAQPNTRGKLILEKDNPSGLPENAEELQIPVFFGAGNTRSIQLYYYNSKADPENFCGPEVVIPVTRNIPMSKTPIQDTIKLLLQGELTNEEKSKGFDTEFPLAGVELKGANLKDGVLTLEFADGQYKTTGGSCRAGILWYQIEKTAKQFPEVKEVRFIPADLFQP